MPTVSISAPGKLMLLGEHAVLYGHPCLVTAIEQRMRAMVELIDEPMFILDAPDVKVIDYRKPMQDLGSGDIPKGAQFVERAVKNFLVDRPYNGGLRIKTASDFHSQFGFGSSSASTVCVTGALLQLFDGSIDHRKAFDLSYKTVLDIQGKGSGFDIAAAVMGGTLLYARGGEIMESIPSDELSIVIGYTGIKVETTPVVREIAERMKVDPEPINRLYEEMGALVKKAESALRKKDWKTLGSLMNDDQKLLSELGVSSDLLDRMNAAAIGAGAYGAKLSGTGRGDCMIALVDAKKQSEVAKAIAEAGGQVIDVACNARGMGNWA